ncbi:MAG: Ig-like domain-containing protein [Niabella sp.]
MGFKNISKGIRSAMMAMTTLLAVQAVQAQAPTTVDCEKGLAYLVLTSESESFLYSVPVEGTPTATSIGSLGGSTYNALGYNSKDGFLYAIDNSDRTIYRIGANGGQVSVTLDDPTDILGTSAMFPPGSTQKRPYTAGDITNGGIYYLYNSATKNLVAVDLNTGKVTQRLNVGTELPTLTGQIDDIVFNPLNGKIYSVTSAKEVVEYDPAANTIAKIGTVGGALPTGLNGTMFIDMSGTLYVGSNTNNRLYSIANIATPPTNGTYTSAQFSAPSFPLDLKLLDGARCPKIVAPSAQNDSLCINAYGDYVLDIINNTNPVVDGVVKDNPGSFPINVRSVKLYVDSSAATPFDADGIIEIPSKGTFTLDATTGKITFKPAEKFQGEAVIWYTVNDNPGTTGYSPSTSNKARIKICSEKPLPVFFTSVTAELINGQLVVNWGTAWEANNNHFEIEVSHDGKNFKKIGDAASKAPNGFSATPLDYSATFDMNGGSLAGIAIFSMAFIALLFNRKNKMFYTLALVAGLGVFGFSSCSKSDAVGDVKTSNTLYVRVKQVDNDLSTKTSKVVTVVKK